MEQTDNKELLRFEKAKKKLSIVFIITSLIICLIILSGCKFTGTFGFVHIAKKNDTLFNELLGYSFIYVVFYVLFYAIMSFFVYVEWYFISGRNKDFYTGKKYRGYHGIIRENDEKYNKELGYVLGVVVKIVSIIEYSILFFMFMFGIIYY